MKAVIAIDSFKGSLSSFEAAELVRKAFLQVFPNGECAVLPLADGGEGTAKVLTLGLGGTLHKVRVTGPMGLPVQAQYGILPQKTAVLEMAQAAGLTLVPVKLRNPLGATTYGVGEMLLDALDAGCRKIIMGIGGSATNDGGLGMLTALGCRFYKADGTPAGICAKDVETVTEADFSGLDPRICQCEIQVACDVNNPLCGQTGASRVFGPQKGADEQTIARLDKALFSYARVVEQTLGAEYSTAPGAGAAGGLGFALLALGAALRGGAQVVLQAANAREVLQGAQLLITGEGRMDAQSAMGKAPVGAAQLAKSCGVKTVIALCGCAADDAQVCNEYGIDAVFPILRMPATVAKVMQPGVAQKNLSLTARQVFLLVKNLYGEG